MKRNIQRKLFRLALTCYVLFFCFPMTVFAKEKPVDITLHEAIVLALRYNSDIVVEDFQRVIDKFSLQVALWQYNIHYNLNGSTSYTHSVSSGITSEGDTESVSPGATLLVPLGTQFSLQMNNNFSHTAGSARFYNPSLVFSATQPLLKGFGPDVTLAPLYEAENQELINRLNMQNVIIGVITNVIIQYAAVAEAKNSLKVQESSLVQSQKILKQQQAYVRIGRVAPSDLVQFEASVASQKLSLEQQEVNYVQQERQLLIILGIDPSVNLNVTDAVHLPTECIPSMKESINIALEHNIGYQQALINLKNANINLTVAIDNQRPSLNATISQTQGGGTGGDPNSGFESLVNGNNANTTVGLSFSVPIDDMSLQQQYVSSKIALRQQETQLAQLKRQIINDVINAYYTVENQKNQIKQAEISVKLAQQSVDIANAKLKYGKVSSFEASTLQTNLLSAQVSYINTVTAYVSNLATFDQILGASLDRWHVELRY